MGKLIVIEGTDGSGKSTQFELACSKLKEMNKPFSRVRFPQYKEPSSTLLRMYLNGDFGSDPRSVNAYAASTFFAVDRYASFKMSWGADYEKNIPILCDRYTTSNAIHQAVKLPDNEAEPFVAWLFDYEYNLLGLPKPDCVIFLDMPSELTFEMLNKRQGESGDIHELDHAYLSLCREKAGAVCDKYGWNRINCAENGNVRTIEAINMDIMKIILKQLGE